ncbi:MAG: cell division ATP-binding protein FtsE [Gemmatimonadota bacterium]|nr:MAG: cell division ATP-binding protein FtsE [Gemmatimonadota bacterium]
MIKLIHLTREFQGKGKALDDVSFHVEKGEFAFLTGHSGSGKTTTLRLIHMADRPTKGETRVSGFSSDRTSRREVWKLRRRVGYVFQDFRLLPRRTALENVAFALEVTGARSAGIKPRAQRLLTQVGLAAKAGSLPSELSGGEQQRVAVARALANDPLVLLADEPTGNLDDRATRGIMELFWELNARGMAVLMATHDLELVRKHPRARVLELDQGKLVYDSTKASTGESGTPDEASSSTAEG